MPLIQDIPTPVHKKTVPTNKEDVYKGVEVDSRYVGKQDLITHISGSSWIVSDYFNQVVNQDDEVNSLNPNRPGFLQQYIRIKDMELMVSSPLSGSPDQETHVYQLEGQATLYPGIVPQHGDMFIADGGDGRALLFTVTRVERKSIFKDTAFAIDYTTTQVLEKAFHEDLIKKSIKEVVYVRELIKYGQRALLSNNEFQLRNELLRQEKDLIEDYFNQFFDQQELSFLMPTEKRIYDPFLVKFVKAIISTDQHRRIGQVRLIPTIVSGDMKTRTLWDGIITRSNRLLTYSENKMAFYPRQAFRGTGLMGTIAYSSIDYVLYPISLMHHKHHSDVNTQYKTINPTKSIHQDIDGKLNVIDGVESLKPEIDLLDSYLFSSNFYSNQKPLSLLEQMVVDFMDQKPINPKTLLKLINISLGWDSLSKYYFHPILILLARVTAGEYR